MAGSDSILCISTVSSIYMDVSNELLNVSMNNYPAGITNYTCSASNGAFKDVVMDEAIGMDFSNGLYQKNPSLVVTAVTAMCDGMTAHLSS